MTRATQITYQKWVQVAVHKVKWPTRVKPQKTGARYALHVW